MNVYAIVRFFPCLDITTSCSLCQRMQQRYCVINTDQEYPASKMHSRRIWKIAFGSTFLDNKGIKDE